MDKAKRARKAETPRQPSLRLRLRAPYLYPDGVDSARGDISSPASPESSWLVRPRSLWAGYGYHSPVADIPRRGDRIPQLPRRGHAVVLRRTRRFPATEAPET